jgi:hypothetical protein
MNEQELENKLFLRLANSKSLIQEVKAVIDETAQENEVFSAWILGISIGVLITNFLQTLLALLFAAPFFIVLNFFFVSSISLALRLLLFLGFFFVLKNLILILQLVFSRNFRILFLVNILIVRYNIE